ncbi:ABC-F family ATP-binding cassette domain-containing protein [Heyndrickxia ginsengihumi]|uniref:ABC-F family ATP-binding cassette domain-containing protein n=1 Tax=Heyndrickxia ginsengihumi TaxID=363870 RepID=A0A6M0P910_9BACI|nr:ABC-F family ATP-binding cassette domain-containing protein [Heyndrickxia ginsengihumi]MBE6184220.1 ABC transporter ATP-binding protein [Bacillus sp. (in: firmicutes)]MCM3023484.1 ABC-F family ATP-binding cassette domain-containing protein [Heyndrickxia ginsengihumi]NEY20360.1 ABC-F family ATP-binding cassette domain-containing protein [Heyndrickxia ginsengihumi]
MRSLAIENFTKSYGEKQLFDHISFHIGENEHIGLIGVNGTGKSSLLTLIAGLDEPDEGEMIHPNDYTIGYLPQQPSLSPDLTVLEQIFQGETAIMQLLRSYEQITIYLEEDPTNENYQNQLFKLQEQMDALDAWEASANAKTILTKLGISDFTKKVGTLSGGQKKRVALAQVLIEKPDLLILDEPTNHLDYPSVKWLEDYISKYRGSVLLVTHDRYFLDHVANRIFELDHGQLYAYKGNYQDFIEAKALREEEMLQQEEKRKNLYRHELAWMKRGAKARSTKQKARIQRFEQLESNIGKIPTNEQVDIALEGSRLGKQVFELKNASKSFQHQKILDHFDWLIKPLDRIGIVGKNGSGKSTFMNILARNIQLDSGELLIGQTVNIAYYKQEIDEMNENKRMIEYIREFGDSVTTKDGETISAAQMLERFLFEKHTHGTPIYKLSGGEKRRLYLLSLLMGRPNVLLLDEPTNDLDTQTLTVLEDYIEQFPGVVISVSHDRYFLDKTAEQLLIFKGDAVIDQYYGSYSDYLEHERKNEKSSKEPKKELVIEQKVKQKKKKMSYSEQKEWEAIDENIEQCEEKIKQLNQELHQVGSDFMKAQEIMNVLEEENEKLEYLIERWDYLSELQNS